MKEMETALMRGTLEAELLKLGEVADAADVVYALPPISPNSS